MRKIIIALFLSILLIAIGIYLCVNISPFQNDTILQVATTDNIMTNVAFIVSLDEYISNGFVWDFIDTQNFFSCMGVWALGLLSLFCFFHLLIDKMFFRKFYEEPSLFNAFRRGAFLVAILIGIIFLRLIDGYIWYNILSIILLFVFIEIGFINIFRKKAKKKV